MADRDGTYDSATHGAFLNFYDGTLGGMEGSLADWDAVVVVIPDAAAPEIVDIVPPPGSISRTAAVTFSVVDPESASVIIAPIWVIYPATNTVEPVYDGSVFFPPFDTSSTATPRMDGGIDFSITRDGEWPSPPTFRCRPADAAGNI